MSAVADLPAVTAVTAPVTASYGQCSNLEFAGDLGRPPFPHYLRHVLYLAAGPAIYSITLAASHGDGPKGMAHGAAAAEAVAAAKAAAAGTVAAAAAVVAASE